MQIFTFLFCALIKLDETALLATDIAIAIVIIVAICTKCQQKKENNRGVVGKVDVCGLSNNSNQNCK